MKERPPLGLQMKHCFSAQGSLRQLPDQVGAFPVEVGLGLVRVLGEVEGEALAAGLGQRTTGFGQQQKRLAAMSLKHDRLMVKRKLMIEARLRE